MRNPEIDSILLINRHFTNCKLTNPFCPRTEMFRKYLLKKVNKALVKKESPHRMNYLMSKAFGFLMLFVVTNF